MGKKSTQERVLQFRRDFSLLRGKYALNMIAERTEADPGNLSNYGRGVKKPGEDFLDKFYSIFAAEIPGPARDPGSPNNGAGYLAEEQPQEYLRRDERDDHIQTLKLNNEDLRNYLSAVVRSNEMLALSNQKLVEAQLLLIARLDKFNLEARG